MIKRHSQTKPTVIRRIDEISTLFPKEIQHLESRLFGTLAHCRLPALAEVHCT
jgi:hypothetical protein